MTDVQIYEDVNGSRQIMANLEFTTEFVIWAKSITLEHTNELSLHLIGF